LSSPEQAELQDVVPFPVFQPLPQAAAWTRWKRRRSSAGLQLAVVSRAFLIELRRRLLRY
jgi:hypothetical protein